MKAKNKLLTLLILSAGAAVTTAGINKAIQFSAVSKNLLAEPEPLCFKWRLGNVYYTKEGTGKPLLLIHDLDTCTSGYEWKQLIPFLSSKYTVYTVDLLGFGRSEKANMTYTNFLFVQLISDFIKSEIGHRTSIITSGETASIPLMACANNPDLFDQIMAINPLSLLDFSSIPGKTAKMYKCMIELPIIGTLLYNIASSKKMIMEELITKKLFNPYSVKSSYVDACYEAAHRGASPKSTFASIRCNYTKCNLVNALKKIDNSIYLVGGANIDNIEERLNEYKNYNSSIETILVPQTKELAHFEHPEKIAELVKTYFC